MKPWYRTSTLQMDDAEMEWLQSQHPATCAVWEWLKGDCQKRDSSAVRVLSEQEAGVICRKLGISLPEFSQVSQNLQTIKWVVDGHLKSWSKWQDTGRTEKEDALRKQVEYWKCKAENQPVTEQDEKSPSFLPKPPNPPTRGEETIGEERRSTEGDSYHKDSRTALHLLNEASSRNFRERDTNLSVISARLKEPGVELDGVKRMIHRQAKLWRGTKMEEYLTPATLFGKTNFDKYYAANELQIQLDQQQFRPKPYAK